MLNILKTREMPWQHSINKQKMNWQISQDIPVREDKKYIKHESKIKYVAFQMSHRNAADIM